jgi:hypothetical protein
VLVGLLDRGSVYLLVGSLDQGSVYQLVGLLDRGSVYLLVGLLDQGSVYPRPLKLKIHKTDDALYTSCCKFLLYS